MATSAPLRLIGQLGKGHQLASTNQFVVNGVKYGGAIRALSGCFYEKNFKRFGVRRRGKASSSRETGIRLHQHIYHAFTCIKHAKCLCKARFGKITRKPKAGSQLAMFLEGFKAFLVKHDWRVLECEMVAAIPSVRRATSIDVVCTDSNPIPTKIFVIEIKTGYDVGRNIPRTLDKTGMMCGQYGREIPNTFSNHHQLQLWFGTEALEQTYGVVVDRAVVVYLKKSGKFSAEFGKDWWFPSKAKRERLRAQLMLHTMTC